MFKPGRPRPGQTSKSARPASQAGRAAKPAWPAGLAQPRPARPPRTAGQARPARPGQSGGLAWPGLSWFEHFKLSKESTFSISKCHTSTIYISKFKIPSIQNSKLQFNVVVIYIP